MPQGLGRNLYPSLSVKENLDFFGRLFAQDRATRNQRIAGVADGHGIGRVRRTSVPPTSRAG